MHLSQSAKISLILRIKKVSNNDTTKYVEERDGRLAGFEFKWKNSKTRPPATWLDTYAESSFEVVNRDNFLDFVV